MPPAIAWFARRRLRDRGQLLEEALDIAVEDRITAAAYGSGTGTLSALTDVGAPELCNFTDLRLAASGGGGGPWSGTRS